MGKRLNEPVEGVPSHCPNGGCYLWWQDHTLSKVLLKCLRAIYDAHGTEFGPTRDSYAQMGHSWRGNYLKLEYWDLIEWRRDESDRKIHGELRCTEDGRDFLLGKVAIPKIAVTRKANGPDAVIVRLEGPLIYAHDIDVTCWEREDYLAHRRPLKEVR